MNDQVTGAMLVVVGAIALIMAVKGSWRQVWHALAPGSAAGKQTASDLASFTFGPGGVTTSGGGSAPGSGSPGAAPAPLGGSYSRLVRGPTFAGVDQGIDFTGRGSVLALARGRITRLMRSGSGWPGQGALLVEHLESGPGAGRYVYVAEDFDPAAGLQVGSEVAAGSELGLATGSGRAPGIEIGWADPSGHAYGHASPREPQAAGYSFQRFVEALG